MAKASRKAKKSASQGKARTPGKTSAPKKTRAPKKPAALPGDLSTEEKIMQAAKKLFTQNGFAATRTRDIAEEAGINLALLNYYFRSKEKLFDIVMIDNFRQFIRGVSLNVLDETATLNEKIQRIVAAYIDFLSHHPDLPIFIINEMRGNSSKIMRQINEELIPLRGHLFRRLQEAGQQGIIPPFDPFHFIVNLIGLTVFPFIGRPVIQRVTNTDDKQFQALMEERKTLVPLWINAILHAK